MKLVIFNVHALSGNRINRVVGLLKKIEPDVIFLQEISQNVLIQVANGLKHNYRWAKAGFLGNGLLTSHNICNSINIALDINGICETRSAIKATINTPYGKIKFIGTHLDHLYENNRLEQLKLLSVYMHNVDFVMGDFNSINLSDYNSDGINIINSVRNQGGIEHVSGKVMEYVKHIGYNVTPFVSWTSRFQTRIDFILYKNAEKWNVNEKIFNTIDSHHSDHCLVLAEVLKK